MFYNTTREYGDLLKMYKAKTLGQDDLVRTVFLKELRPLSSHDVEDLLGGKLVRSSVVRSMNTLTKLGFLEKTYKKRTGKFGRQVYLWQIRNQEDQTSML